MWDDKLRVTLKAADDCFETPCVSDISVDSVLHQLHRRRLRRLGALATLLLVAGLPLLLSRGTHVPPVSDTPSRKEVQTANTAEPLRDLDQIVREAEYQESLVMFLSSRRKLDEMVNAQPTFLAPELSWQCEVDRAAINTLYDAEQFAENTMYDEAAKRYRAVIRRFPGTRWEEVALGSLASLTSM